MSLPARSRNAPPVSARGIKQSLRACFLDDKGKPTDHGMRLLTYLAWFCHSNRSSIKLNRTGVDPMATAMAEGRREVWLFIQDYMHLDEQELTRWEQVERQRMLAMQREDRAA